MVEPHSTYVWKSEAFPYIYCLKTVVFNVSEDKDFKYVDDGVQNDEKK